MCQAKKNIGGEKKDFSCHLWSPSKKQNFRRFIFSCVKTPGAQEDNVVCIKGPEEYKTWTSCLRRRDARWLFVYSRTLESASSVPAVWSRAWSQCCGPRYRWGHPVPSWWRKRWCRPARWHRLGDRKHGWRGSRSRHPTGRWRRPARRSPEPSSEEAMTQKHGDESKSFFYTSPEFNSYLLWIRGSCLTDLVYVDGCDPSRVTLQGEEATRVL